MQSSSTCGGGDEESLFSTLSDKASSTPSSLVQSIYVSRSTSSVANNRNCHTLGSLSSYFDPIQRSQQNFNTECSKVVRSETNHSDLTSLIASSISSSSSNNDQASLSSLGQTRGVGVSVLGHHATFPTTYHSSMPIPPNESASRVLLFSQDQAQNHNKNMVRNPKKRSRASKRAPTTVLTTNTSNFRAMVQEFTGIPTPSLTSLPFQRTRLDIFGSSSSTIRSLDTPQSPYLICNFPPSSSTSSIPISMLDSNINNTLLGSNHFAIDSSSNSPQFMMNNMHNNPILNLQGQQAQQNTKYPLGNSSKTQPAFENANTNVDNSQLKMSAFDELGLLNHAHVNNMISSSSAASSRVNNNNMGNPSSPLEWVQRTGTTLLSSNHNNNDGGNNHGNYPSNNIHVEKGPECSVAAKSEGMVESWINCSSD